MKKENSGRNNTINYKYRFSFAGGKESVLNIRLDKNTLTLIPDQREAYPEWTRLEYYRCPNCSLDESKVKYCPSAVNTVELIDMFKDSLSFEEVDILVETETRSYSKHTSLQVGLSSVLGLFMVTSGCPVTEKLKSMAYNHLPFATSEETMYRVISAHLLAQYFLRKKGKTPDWELKELIKTYDDIHVINMNFFKRISNIKIEDASLNAIAILDTFANLVPFSIDEEMLGEIEQMFDAYLK
ncbi:MAG TPA: hypothetical protein ENH40_04960 [Nitrospirae bacterium]|nr:hypothetical protein [Nitrospirota bacterium]